MTNILAQAYYITNQIQLPLIWKFYLKRMMK